MTEPDIPDGGYGWVIVAAVFWNNAHTWGIVTSYGVFLSTFLQPPPYFPPSTSRINYAFTGGLVVGIALLFAPFVNILNRTCGIRTTLSIGVTLETLGLLGSSFATRIWHLYLSYGVRFGLGLGIQFIVVIALVPQWFNARRSLASGIASGGSGVGGLVYSLAAGEMIKVLGVGWAYRVLAVVQCVVNFVCVLLIKDRRHVIGTTKRSFDAQVLGRKEAWVLIFWGVLSVIGMLGINFSLGDYARVVGLSAGQASVVTALMNFGQAFGRPLTGFVSDRWGRINVAMGATFMSGVFCLVLWLNARSYAAMIAFALCEGAIFGVFWIAIAPLGADTLGLLHLPSFMTAVWVICSVPATFSAAIPIGLSPSSTRPYLNVQIVVAALYFAATLCMLLLRFWSIRAERRESEQSSQDEDGENEANCRSNNQEKLSIGRRVASISGDVFRWQKI